MQYSAIFTAVQIKQKKVQEEPCKHQISIQKIIDILSFLLCPNLDLSGKKINGMFISKHVV